MTFSVCRDILQQFLLSDATPRDSMCICELDGFLNGIAAGPKPIPMREWSVVVWGSGKPNYRSVEQQKLILDLLSRRYADIATLLEGSSEDTAAVEAEDCDDSIVMASSWANGFLQAMELRMDAWRPLLQDPASGMFLLPLMNLSRDLSEDYDLPFSPALSRAMVSMAAVQLPTCARRIRQFWRNREDKDSGRLLKRLDGISHERGASDLVIGPLAADLSNATADHAMASPAEIVQSNALENVVKMSGRQSVEPQSFSDKLSSILEEEALFGTKATLLTDRTFLRVPQNVPEGAAEPEPPEAVMITDRSGVILSVNQAFTSITGYSGGEVVGQTPRVLKCSLVSAAEHVSFWTDLLNTGRWHGHVWNRSRGGEPFLISQTVTRVGNANGEPFGYVSVFKKVDRHHLEAVDCQRSASAL
jgi:uncharacterized protein